MAKSAEKIKRVALYVRVSTAEQAEKGTSIRSQIELLREHCKINNLQVYNEYIDDGYSGATANRPALQELLSDAKKAAFDIVLVYKTDRLSRSIPLTVKLVLETFQAIDIDFKSISEPYDTSTPAGRMFFVQLAGFADFERGMIRERTVEGRLRKAREGKWVSGAAHYAYDIDKNQNLVLNKERSKVFRQIVDWTLSGKSGIWIADELTRRGIPTYNDIHGIKRKYSQHRWHQTIIQRMLLNKVIIGEAYFSGIKIKAPSIVTKEEYEKIMVQFKKNLESAKRNTKHFYLLRGLLVCKRCGRNLWGKQRSRKRDSGHIYKNFYYYCPSTNSKKTTCGLKRIDLTTIEAYIWDLTKDLITNSEKLMNAIKDKNIDLFTNDIIIKEQIKELDANILGLESELDRILSLYSKGTIFTIDELDSKARVIKNKIDEIKKKQDLLKETEKRLLVKKKLLNNSQKYFKSIRSRLEDFSIEEKQKLVKSLFYKIIVDWNEEKGAFNLDIEGTVPVNKKNIGTIVKKYPVAIEAPG